MKSFALKLTLQRIHQLNACGYFRRKHFHVSKVTVRMDTGTGIFLYNFKCFHFMSYYHPYFTLSLYFLYVDGSGDKAMLTNGSPMVVWLSTAIC